MNHHDVPGAIAVRMGVFFSWPPVSGPTRVADSKGSFDRTEAHRLLQVVELTGGPSNRQLIIAAIYGQTGRIVPTVFQTAQPLQNDRNRVAASDITHDPAHRFPL